MKNVPVLVGRVSELTLLADCLAEGRPLVLVGGACGGKTTALRAAAATTGTIKHTVKGRSAAFAARPQKSPTG